ncbi:MAG: hypothetical protein B7Y41_15115 [Hydrogenophilales bacterium 28-61-23]|nr:MAG: hypothetical protein B7Y41_15115 [Hydrogenophilales bacterium 28-61-23]
MIWATRVSDQPIQENPFSRAECVILNKELFVLDALAMLDDIACRMRAHQRKKSARLRALHW